MAGQSDDLDPILAAVRKKTPPPVVLLSGQETYLSRRYAREIIDTALAGALPDFNLDRFDGRQVDGDRLVGACRSLPVMAPLRVVHVRDAETMRPAAQEKLAAYLDDPSPSTVLVLEAVKADMRKKAFARVKQAGRVIDCKPLYPNRLGPWVSTLAKETGKKIDAAASRDLIQLVGANLAQLESEIRKVALYAGDEDPIRSEHVRAVVADIREENIFQMADAVADGKTGEALHMLSKLSEAGEYPLRILSMIARHFRILTLVRAGADGGADGREVAQAMGVPPRFASQYVQQASGFAAGVLERAYLAIRDADFAMKSSRIPERRILESLVLDLCAGRGA